MDGDRVGTVGGLRHHRAADGVGRDADLGLIDDRHRQHRAGDPLLEIVNVPPWISSGLSLRARARLARSLISRASAFSRLVSALRITGEETLVVEVDGDAEVDVVVHEQLVVADAGVEVWELG